MATKSDILPSTESPALEKDGSLKRDQRFWLEYLKTEIAVAYHADIPIILCCMVSGLCDSSAYNAWSCFVSMQTGNTVFLALGASNLPATKPYGWLKSLISILFFLLGSLSFSQTRSFRPITRLTLSISMLTQALLIFIAAILVQTNVVPSPIDGAVAEVNFYELIPLALLAFQSGGQIVTSRILGFNEVPTTVLTSVYCDLMMDTKLLKAGNVKRDRRASAVVAFLVGGIAGGWLSRSSGGMESALWFAGAIKLCIAIAWLCWKGR